MSRQNTFKKQPQYKRTILQTNKIYIMPRSHVEDEISKEFAKILRLKWYTFTHINNEMWTSSRSQKNRSKAMWVSPWVPDYMVVVKRKGLQNKLVFIEMKRKWWRVSEHQKKRIDELYSCWWVQAHLAYWLEEALQIIEKVENSK